MRCIATRAAASERGDAETSIRLRAGGRARAGQAPRVGPARPAFEPFEPLVPLVTREARKHGVALGEAAVFTVHAPFKGL